MKKLLLTICLIFLTACSQASSSSKDYSAADYARKAVSDLSLSDMEEVKKRVIIGAVFDEKKDICSDVSMYRSTKEGNNNCVGIFMTDDPDTCLSYLNDYLISIKKESELDYPSEVFKISNAVLESNDHMAVMIVCENIEQAKREADSILNNGK